MAKSRFLISVSVIIAAFLVSCGGKNDEKTFDKNSMEAQRTVQTYYKELWSGNTEKAWSMLHPMWREGRYNGNYASYANDAEELNKAWKDNPRSIVRMKTFRAVIYPGNTRFMVASLGEKDYDYIVVKAQVHYPEVKDYKEEDIPLLITLLKAKKKGADWQILSIFRDIGSIEYYSW